MQVAGDGGVEGGPRTGGVPLGLGEVDVGLAETSVAGPAEPWGIELAAVRATGVAPQPARTSATVNAAAAATTVDLMAM